MGRFTSSVMDRENWHAAVHGVSQRQDLATEQQRATTAAMREGRISAYKQMICHSLISTKGVYSQSYGFSSCHIWMCQLDHKES